MTSEPKPRPWRDLTRGPAGWTALALLLAHAVMRALLLRSAFFTQDDYLMIAKVVRRPMTAGLLFQGYSGHLFPGGFLLAWLQTALFPMSWNAAALLILALAVIASVLAWLVVAALVPPGWYRVVPLTVVLFNPLTLWSVQWWAVAIQFLPVTIFALLALWARLRWQREPNLVVGILVPMSFVGALCFQERGLLVPIEVFMTGAAVGGAAGVLPRLRRTLRDGWWQWATCVVVGVGYLLLHRGLVPITTDSGVPISDRVDMAGNVIFRNALPGLWGGPGWGRVVGDSLIEPPTPVVVVATLATVALLIWTVRRYRSAAVWAWATLAVVGAVNVGLLFGGRTHLGPAFGLIPRYAADLVPVLMVAICVVARRASQGATDGAPDAVGWGVRGIQTTAAAYLALSALTTAVMAPHTFNTLDRQWVTTAREDLRKQPQVVLFDGGVPDDMMISWFGADARVSTVLAAAPEHPVFDAPTPRLSMVDPAGHIKEVALVGSTQVRTPLDRQCGYHVTARPLSIDLMATLQPSKQVLRMGYYISVPATATLTIAGHETTFAVFPGLNAVDLVVDGDRARSVEIRIDNASATMCVPALEVGFPTPLGG